MSPNPPERFPVPTQGARITDEVHSHTSQGYAADTVMWCDGSNQRAIIERSTCAPRDCEAASEECLWEGPAWSTGGGLGADMAAAWTAAACARFAAASALAGGCARAADVVVTPSLHILCMIWCRRGCMHIKILLHFDATNHRGRQWKPCLSLKCLCPVLSSAPPRAAACSLLLRYISCGR